MNFTTIKIILAFTLFWIAFFNYAGIALSNKMPVIYNINGECKKLVEKDSEVHLKDFTRLELDNQSKYPWFKAGYDSYKPELPILDSLRYYSKLAKIIAFGGSWCSDTKKLLPAFYKVVEAVGIPSENIILIGVSRRKKSEGRESKHYHIKKVPTFILFFNGKELGRVIEKVDKSIEFDMLKIYKGKLSDK